VNTPSAPIASEVARQAIRLLAERRLPPTPDNYAAVYREIAGSDDGSETLVALRLLDRLAATLPPGAQPLLRALEARRWTEVERLLSAALGRNGADAGPALAETLRTLLKQWDARHADVTRARKREGVEHILTTCAGDPHALVTRLARLTAGWGAGRAAEMSESQRVATDVDEESPQSVAAALLARLLRFAFVDRAGIEPATAAEATALADLAARARTRHDLDELEKALNTFRLRFELVEQRDASLAHLLHAVVGLLVQNLGSLVDDEDAVRGQIEQLRVLVAEPPTPRGVRQVESSLRALVYRQFLAKHSLAQAKESLKSMLQTFLVRLGDMADATGSYQERIAGHAAQIAGARDIAELCHVVEALSEDARSMQTDLARNRDELIAERDRAAGYAAEVRRLEAELLAASAAAREDALTQVLNRRGLEEAFAVETARADRSGAPLSVALLDIDNFKGLNDRLGHAAGDGALTHLADVVRESLRPTDVVARFGGEEFVVLLPGTPLEDAADVMTRVQRELTRRFFLHNNERVLVTFSAGVTRRAPGEPPEAALDRADAAMMRAKREGKNRVVAV
jgi:diguanylate cyclase